MEMNQLEKMINEHSRRYMPNSQELRITYLRDDVSNVHYKIILNETRKEEERTNLQSFEESIEEFKNHKYNNTTVLSEYRNNHGPLFYVALNPRPILKGALVLIRELGEEKTVDDEIDKGSLETMLRFSKSTGAKLWHNMSGSGATIKKAHWQGFFSQSFDITQFERDRLNGSGIYTMPKYAGENFVFTGNQKIEKCLEIITKINQIPFEDKRPILSEELRPKFYEKPKHVPYCVIIANDEIYLIPVENEYAALSFGLGSTRIAGAELGLLAIITTEETDYNEINNNTKIIDGRRRILSPKEIHKEALYQKGVIMYILGYYKSKNKAA